MIEGGHQSQDVHGHHERMAGPLDRRSKALGPLSDAVDPDDQVDQIPGEENAGSLSGHEQAIAAPLRKPGPGKRRLVALFHRPPQGMRTLLNHAFMFATLTC